MLLDYANFYPLLLIRDIDYIVNGGSGGRILSQTLDESSWLIKAAIAYDFVADTMSDAGILDYYIWEYLLGFRQGFCGV
jgi:hypothetical protein